MRKKKTEDKGGGGGGHREIWRIHKQNKKSDMIKFVKYNLKIGRVFFSPRRKLNNK